LGDAAEMAMIELVDFNEIYTGKPEKTEKKKATRRSRKKFSGTSKAESNSGASESSAETKTEE
jgi:large subunit ribosomal protein L17